MHCLVDVRAAEEFNSGHIEGAKHIPYEEIGVRIGELTDDKSREIVLYCRSGRRSGVWALRSKRTGTSLSSADCLQTARLRHVAADDLDHIYSLDNDPEVMRYINATPREVVRQDIMPVFTRRTADAGLRARGCLNLRPTDATGTVAALGYRLSGVGLWLRRRGFVR